MLASVHEFVCANPRGAFIAAGTVLVPIVSAVADKVHRDAAKRAKKAEADAKKAEADAKQAKADAKKAEAGPKKAEADAKKAEAAARKEELFAKFPGLRDLDGAARGGEAFSKEHRDRYKDREELGVDALTGFVVSTALAVVLWPSPLGLEQGVAIAALTGAALHRIRFWSARRAAFNDGANCFRKLQTRVNDALLDGDDSKATLQALRELRDEAYARQNGAWKEAHEARRAGTDGLAEPLKKLQ